LWIKGNLLTVNPSWEWIVTKGNTSWRLMGVPGAKTVVFYASGTTNLSLMASTRNVNDGQWHHVAGVYDGTNISLYVDGTLDVSQPDTGSILQNNQPVEIGQIAGAAGDIFNGLIDEVSIYHRALSASEIAAIYNAGGSGKCPLPPTILVQPTNQTAAMGNTATFSVTASGTPPLFYQWSFNGTNNISGATTNSLTLTNVQFSQAGAYSVMVANAGGSVASSNAILTVLAPPTILSQPTNLAVIRSSNATFSVTATGSLPLKYLWNFNSSNFIAVTNNCLTLTNVQLYQAGNYTVLVTNNYGSILSSNAMLVVNPLFHFVWNTIPSPRFANTPFAVIVQAQNTTNGIATNFTDTVVLLSTNGVPVHPAISGNFVQGVWTGAVAVVQTATNLVLQASDSFGESGVANPINVIGLPALTTIPSGGSLLIFWPVNPAGFVLEKTAGLSPANWVPVTTSPFQIGDQYLLSIQMSGTNAFYRLRFNGQ
jgi:hypothetical protein